MPGKIRVSKKRDQPETGGWDMIPKIGRVPNPMGLMKCLLGKAAQQAFQPAFRHIGETAEMTEVSPF